MSDIQKRADELRALERGFEQRKRENEAISRQRLGEFVGIMVIHKVEKMPLYRPQLVHVPGSNSMFRSKTPPSQTVRHTYMADGWLITGADGVYGDREDEGRLITEGLAAYTARGPVQNGKRLGLSADTFAYFDRLEDRTYEFSNAHGIDVITRAVMRLAPGALEG
jgi:hypothetical protein